MCLVRMQRVMVLCLPILRKDIWECSLNNSIDFACSSNLHKGE